MSPQHKLRSLAELKRERAGWRDRGLTVVMVNGAFDVLHVGHLRYLEAAKQHGDILFVAVNSDLSVRTSKGPQRPILPEHERVEILSHLWMIDRLVLFDTKSVDSVLNVIQPEFHAKGTDYTVDTVPERDAVLAYGGSTVICGDLKDHATTDLIATIIERFAPKHRE
ncbi:MAG: adenylyltransferase/cytidyltransferase family protein [bacterium]|nr:adenylyltransferase/cytidyltransferase family protein [bacterium]